MARIPGLRRLIRLDATADRVRRDVDDEIAFHLDAVTAELIAAGESPDEARREAERRFGDVEGHRASLRSADSGRAARHRRRGALLDALSDVRYAMRTLVREPAFAFGVVLTLAIGLAANATMFGVVDRLLLRPPLHVRDDPEMSLVYFHVNDPQRGAHTWTSASYADFAALRDQSGAVSDAAAFWRAEASLDRGAAARRVYLGMATGNMFTLLGARPAMGRWFGPADDDPTVSEPAAVLSDALWRGAFNADPRILGRTVHVDGHSYTIVGVAPRGFHGPQTRRVDLWVPMRAVAAGYMGKEFETSRNFRWLRIVAARAPGLSPEVAGARATATYQQVNRVASKGDSLTTVIFGSIIPSRGAGLGGAGSDGGMMGTGQGGMSTEGKVATWLTGVAAVVLLIVCANLANLLLSRASRRRREVAVRLAIGIRRGRLVRQLLCETALLSMIGGVVGVLFAWWGSALMRATLLSEMAWDTSFIDARVIGFTAAACALTVLVAGLTPALVASRQDLTSALKSGSREGHRRTPLQGALLVAQGALSAILLVGAGLFVQSLRNVSTIRLGFDVEQVLVADVDVTALMGSAANTRAFFREAAERVRTLPGVQTASIAVTTPFNSSWATDFALPGRDSLPELKGDGPYINAVTTEFLETMGTRVLSGRGFAPSDVKGASQVAVVSRFMEQTLWPGGSAVGQCIKVGADTAPCTTVVGVVENAFRDDLREAPTAQYLVLLDQGTWDAPGMQSLFIRTRGDPQLVAESVRKTLQSLRPDLPYADVRTLRRIIEPGMQPWTLGATMFGLFGGIALLVAAIGLYAVLGYDVSQRWHEFGVRSALGARPGHLRRQVIGDGIRQAALGVGLGVAVAWWVAPAVSDVLFRVSPRDGLTYLAVAVVLLAAALAACAVPARRATRIAPAEVLRSD